MPALARPLSDWGRYCLVSAQGSNGPLLEPSEVAAGPDSRFRIRVSETWRPGAAFGGFGGLGAAFGGPRGSDGIFDKLAVPALARFLPQGLSNWG